LISPAVSVPEPDTDPTGSVNTRLIRFGSESVMFRIIVQIRGLEGCHVGGGGRHDAFVDSECQKSSRIIADVSCRPLLPIWQFARLRIWTIQTMVSLAPTTAFGQLILFIGSASSPKVEYKTRASLGNLLATY